MEKARPKVKVRMYRLRTSGSAELIPKEIPYDSQERPETPLVKSATIEPNTIAARTKSTRIRFFLNFI